MAKFDKEFLLSTGLNVDDHGSIINKILNRHSAIRGDFEREASDVQKEITQLKTDLAAANDRAKEAEDSLRVALADEADDTELSTLREEVHGNQLFGYIDE